MACIISIWNVVDNLLQILRIFLFFKDTQITCIARYNDNVKHCTMAWYDNKSSENKKSTE